MSALKTLKHSDYDNLNFVLEKKTFTTYKKAKILIINHKQIFDWKYIIILPSLPKFHKDRKALAFDSLYISYKKSVKNAVIWRRFRLHSS